MKLPPNLVSAEEPVKPKTQPAARPASGHSKTEALNLELIPIPDHELLQRIGGGSYGEVWLARSALGAYRAVKIIHRQNFEDDRPFEREFNGIQKFEPISRSHDGLVDILQAGRQEDYFYYVMELADGADSKRIDGVMDSWIDGGTPADHKSNTPSIQYPATYTPRTLRAVLKERGRLPVDECLEIALALSSALAHLHRHGLVHRDIKPSNIIFVQGAPKLADIGLVTDADTTLSYVGTEGYIPPEGPGAAQADIFGLGKVLYEMATGQDRRHFPDLPPDLKNWPGYAAVLELNEILLKACARDARQRYESAEEMQAELELLQRGESVQRKHATQRRLVLAKKFSLAAATVVFALAAVWFAVDRFSLHPNRAVKVQLPKSWKPSPEAKKLYDEGWAHLMKQTKDGTIRSIDCFNRATELEPNYALAFCALSDAYMSQSEVVLPPIQTLPEARKNARRAIEIDDDLPDGHRELGMALLAAYDFAGAEIELKRAVTLGPSNGWMHTGYAQLLQTLGRTVEAREHALQASTLGRRENVKFRDWFYQLWSERKFDEALEQAEHLNQVAPDWAMTPWLRAQAYAACGRFDDAARELRRVRALDDDPFGAGVLGYVYGRMGKTNDARAVLTELQNWRSNRRVCPHTEAYIYAGLREKTEAIRQLHLAYDDRCTALLRLQFEPYWDDLRSEPDFQVLLRKVGLAK